MVCASDRDGDGGALDFCICHLRGEGALTDQVIESLLLRCAADVLAVNISGANSFVCLLCSLALGLEAAWLVVFLPWMLLDLSGYCAEGLRREIDRVRTHISDVP